MMMKSENEVKYENVATDEEPPACDHTQAIFIRDEKSAAVSHIELGLLGMESSKSPNESGIMDRKDLRDGMMFLSIVYITVFFLRLLDGFNMITGRLLITAIVHFTGFTTLYLEKRVMLKAFLVLYTLYYLVNTMINGCIVLYVWYPSFCREMASSVPGFRYQQGEENPGIDRAIGIFAMIGMAACEAHWLHTLHKVVRNDEMIENPKKQTSSKTTSILLA